MRRILITIALTSSLLAACGGNEPTAGPEEEATIAELEEAVGGAAMALLENESVPIAVIYFGYDDREQIVRYDWIDYRSNGDVLAIYNYLVSVDTIGLSRSQSQWSMARISAEETSPWEAEPTLGTVRETLPTIGQLIVMTEAATAEFNPTNPSLANQVTRQGASDGSELWSLVVPRDAETTLVTAQWIISPDGLLQFHRLFSEATPLSSRAGTIIYEYGIDDKGPDPIIVPQQGTSLVLNDLGIPQALLDIEE